MNARMRHPHLATLVLASPLLLGGCRASLDPEGARSSLRRAEVSEARPAVVVPAAPADSQGPALATRVAVSAGRTAPAPDARSTAAATPAPGSLHDVLAAVLARNPDVQRLRAEWRAAIEQVPQATALPDPMLSVLSYVESVQTRVGPQDQVFTFQQRIPWPGKLSQAGHVAAEGARIAGLRYAAGARDALVLAKIGWYEYGYLLRARDLVRQNQAVAERLAGLGSELLTEDHALLIDVLKAQSQLAQLQYDLVTVEELISAERTRLNGLMGRDPEAPIGAPPEPDFPRIRVPVTDLYRLAVRNREEIRISNRRIEQAFWKQRLAASQRAPDITLGLSYVRVGPNAPPLMTPADNGQDAWGVSVGLTLPIWDTKNRAATRQAEAERDAAVAGRTEVVAETYTGIKDGYVRLANAERLVLLYRDSLIPQAEKVMSSAEDLARDDRMRLGDYLEAQTVWLNFTLARERALADYQQSIARLERWTGSNLAPQTSEARK